MSPCYLGPRGLGYLRYNAVSYTHLDVYKRQVSLTGTTFDFGPSRPRFAVKAKFDKVDIQNVLAFKSNDLAKKLTGQGSMDISADGQGLRWEDIAPRLVGQLNMGISDGKLTTAKLGSQVIAPLALSLIHI